jgi:hypothetical protein
VFIFICIQVEGRGGVHFGLVLVEIRRDPEHVGDIKGFIGENAEVGDLTTCRLFKSGASFVAGAGMAPREGIKAR